MTRPPKGRIRQSFERAASTYDIAAAIQRAICDDLLAGLPEFPVTRLLDAGSGTGYALPLLGRRFPEAQLVAIDLSTAMLGRSPIGCHRLAGDLENLPLAAASIDLYWSSLAVQWCDLPRVLADARRALRPQGVLALASLGPQTFHELRSAFTGVDDYRHTLGFHPAAAIEAIAAASGLTTIRRTSCEKIACYPDFRTLLRAVKAIGANQLGEGRRTSLMSRAAWRQAELAYESMRRPDGLPLTYDVVALYAEKAARP